MRRNNPFHASRVASFRHWMLTGALLLSGGWLLWRVADGRLQEYVHPRFSPLVGACGLALVALGLWVGYARRNIGAETVIGALLLGMVAIAGVTLPPQTQGGDSLATNLRSSSTYE